MLDGYPESELASGGRGQVLFPWPNRLAGGRWDDEGATRQLPLSEAGAGNAIHGLVRWAAWDVRPAGEAAATATPHPHAAAGLSRSGWPAGSTTGSAPAA